MTGSDPAAEIAELLREACRVHIQVFGEGDGADPDWPLWYASYLLERFRLRLDPALTRSALACALVLAAEDHARRAPDAEWAAHLAGYLTARYRSSPP